MSASWAELRSLCTYYDMTTVAAFPNLDFALLEHFLCLNIAEQSAITLLMTLLDCSYETELCSKLLEAFFFSCLCEAIIHVSPLIVLAIGSSSKVLSSCANTLKFLEPELSVLLLIVGSVLEDGSDLLKTILLCTRSEI